jgi:Xaa-Pro dipeptidase
MSAMGSERDLEVRLASAFSPHIEAVCRRAAQALAACGYSGLLVYAGSPLPVFEDDRTYPFEANAPFKVWVPLSNAPGSFLWFEPGAAPRLIIERPEDYWYKPADLPQGYWVPHFDIRIARDRAAARAELPADLSRAAYVGDAFAELPAWGVAAVNPPPLMHRLDYVRAVKSPYELTCLR